MTEWKQYTVQSALARRMRQGCTSPPPFSLLHTVGWLQNFCFHNFTKFLRNLNSLLFIIIIYYFNYQNYFFKILCFPKFWQNNFNFAKFEENFAKREIKNLAKHEIKIFVKLQKQNFAATLLLLNLASATHPPLLSATHGGIYGAAQGGEND